MSMFDPEFFPTPSAVAWKMFEPYRAAIESGEIGAILDPSAGKGDLLKPVLSMRETARPKLYAIEKNLDLRNAVAGMEGASTWGNEKRPVRVLGDDCFAYQGRHVFDLILMNPPFSCGDKHLLRAWEMAAPGGHIACLLNAETVDNPWTKGREAIAEIVRQHGTVEKLGKAFSRAERATDVDVALVRLRKPDAHAAARFNFARADRTRNEAPRFEAADIENEIARQDIVGNVAIAFDLASRALAELSQAWQRADHYLAAAGVSLHTLVPVEGRALAQPDNLNELIDAAQAKAWHSVIERSNVSGSFTEKMRREFDEFMAQQGSLDFNKPNILALFDTIFQSRHSIADQCVQDVFDKLCSYDKDNKVHVEGWATNSAHKVNVKLVLPWFIEFAGWCGFHLRYSREYSALNDIDKAMCHVTGRSFSTIRTLEATLAEAFKVDHRPSRMEAALVRAKNTATSEFFECRWFKKGTLHLKFRDRAEWEAFNVAAARGKGWLPKASKRSAA